MESDFLNVLGALVRWVHLAACVGLAGIAAFLLIAGRGDETGAREWREQMLRWSRALVVAAIAAGILTLGHQTIVFEGRHSAAFELPALGRVLFDTRLGIVWLVRHALLVLLALVLAARLDESRRADWIASRGQALLLGILVLGLAAASGHAAAVEPDTARAVAIGAVHLLATGLWVGGLPALAALLRAAGREDVEDLRRYAARAARRFSRVALASVLVLAATGIANALAHVGSVAGLFGTPYGHLLLLKLALLVPILALAAIARRRLVPALMSPATSARRAARGLRRVALTEAGFASAILLVVAVMSVTRPARHDQPTWPFAFRLVPSAQAAGVLALPSTVIDANPGTYSRPAVPYTAASIVTGAALYEQHCAACHGADGAGGGPLATGVQQPRLDLRSALVRARTAGDLYWSITHGSAGSAMPAFGERLSAEHRWDLVNYVRTLDAAEVSQRVGVSVEATQPRVVAPDFIFSVGPIPPRALRDFRASRMVLLVLYTLPASRPRMAELAKTVDALDLQGVEIIAVPTNASRNAIRELGAERGLYFSVVTDGASEIVDAYRLLAGGALHAEFLIDRQGYIRTRSVGEPALTRPLDRLLAEVQRLRSELPSAPAEEHIH